MRGEEREWVEIIDIRMGRKKAFRRDKEMGR